MWTAEDDSLLLTESSNTSTPTTHPEVNNTDAETYSYWHIVLPYVFVIALLCIVIGLLIVYIMKLKKCL